MFPVLLKIGPLTIHTYGFMMAVGVALGLWFIYVQAKKAGLDANQIMDAAFYTIIVSLIGAKLILFVSNISYYFSYPKELFSLARSGGVFQGGLTFGVIFALWYFHRKKIPTWKTADLIVPALALGHGFGRIGCFSAGCCYGTECAAPWAVVFKNQYAAQLTGVHLDTPHASRPALRGRPQFPQLRHPLPHPEEEEIRRPGLRLLHHQLLDHPLLHRIFPRRPRGQGLFHPRLVGAFQPVAAAAVLRPGAHRRRRPPRRPEAAQTCRQLISSSGPRPGKGTRLDVFLADKIEGLSRAQVQKVIDAGGVRVGSFARKAGYKLKPGDTIHVEYEVPEPEGALIPQHIPLKIIYMDADVIVIDKPPHLVVHPGPGHPSGTLVNALIYHFPEVALVGNEQRPGIVHRLDQDTSGVMVVARSPRAYTSLREQFKQRVVWKTYLALAWGRVNATEGRLSWPLGRHPKEGLADLHPGPQPQEGRDLLPGPADVQGHDPARGQAGHRTDPPDPGPSGRGRASRRRGPRLRPEAGAARVPAHLPPRPHPVVPPPGDRRSA